MRTVNYDALAASAPLNTDAAIARDGGGVHWAANIPESQRRWDICPPLRHVSQIALGSGLEVYQELFEKRFGRFVVLGIYDGPKAKDSAAVWVCRCDCGYFEGRKAKALRKKHKRPMACFECDRVMWLQEGCPDDSASEAA